eukprot:Polyplicarium_translucidae@DN3243_c0_g1_i10.p1
MRIFLSWLLCVWHVADGVRCDEECLTWRDGCAICVCDQVTASVSCSFVPGCEEPTVPGVACVDREARCGAGCAVWHNGCSGCLCTDDSEKCQKAECDDAIEPHCMLTKKDTKSTCRGGCEIFYDRCHRWLRLPEDTSQGNLRASIGKEIWRAVPKRSSF